MDTLRQMSRREGVPAQKNVPLFHSVFLAPIRRYGRVHEAEMGIVYALRSEGLRGLAHHARMGLDMFARGKIGILPVRLRGRKQIGEIFRKAGEAH
jgi:hypothetical protein